MDKDLLEREMETKTMGIINDALVGGATPAAVALQVRQVLDKISEELRDNDKICPINRETIIIAINTVYGKCLARLGVA